MKRGLCRALYGVQYLKISYQHSRRYSEMEQCAFCFLQRLMLSVCQGRIYHIQRISLACRSRSSEGSISAVSSCLPLSEFVSLQQL